MRRAFGICAILLVGIVIIAEIPLVAYLENFYKPEFPAVWHHVNSNPRKQRSRMIATLPDDIKVEEELKKRLKVASENKVILMWSPPFGSQNPAYIDRDNCGKCQIVYDKAVIDSESTKAVVFHGIDISSTPTTRRQDQLHVFWNMESSANLMYRVLYPKTDISYDFNATMTYRLDSDFLASYQSTELGYKLMGNKRSIFQDIMDMKSKLAIAIVSDCAILPGARIRLRMIKTYKALGLRIDTFGFCFLKRLPREETSNTIKKYKFYFAYENSYHCKDYITEKLFDNAYGCGAVPVVWGAVKEDYEAICPPNSFIFAEDFATHEKLIEYINFLDGNDEEYLKYFRWRTMDAKMTPQLGRQRGFCALCRALHGINVDDRYRPDYEKNKEPLFTNSIRPRTVPSLLYWFYAEDNPECFEKV